MYQAIEIRGSNRNLSRPMTREMESLFKIRPELIKRYAGGLCPFSSGNFNGALLIKLNNEADRADLKRANLPENKMDNPFEIYDHVPVSIYSGLSASHPTGLEAERVLFKNLCGKKAGVVIEGPLTGLVLREDWGIRSDQGLNAIKIWNDEIVDSNQYPYLPQLACEEEKVPLAVWLRRLFEGKKLSQSELRQRIYKRFINRYRLEASEAQKKQETPLYHSDLFGHLTSKLGIDLDTDNFHFTRPRMGI